MADSMKTSKRKATPASKRNDVLPPLQAQAARMRMLEGLTQDEIAGRLGVNRVTVTRWEARPAFQRYARTLEAARHRVVVEAHNRVAVRGAQLRLRVLEKLGAALDTIGVPDGSIGENGLPLPVYVDTEALARVASSLDRLTTSAEDRAGFVARKEPLSIEPPGGEPGTPDLTTPAGMAALRGLLSALPPGLLREALAARDEPA